VVELGKLTDCCLDETHPRGRHKARVFSARLGLGRADAALCSVTAPAAINVLDVVALLVDRPESGAGGDGGRVPR
jgi:hypothetical protein